MRRRGMIGLAVEVLVLSVLAGVASFALVQVRGPGADVSTVDAAAQGSVDRGPVVVDNQGRSVTAEHAGVVRAVHAALTVGNLELLGNLYVGDDWAGQRALLAQPAVREQVLTLLRTHPANLGEGYVYPGFASFGWTGEIDLADGRLLDTNPAALPDPATGYRGYETAFFLSPDGTDSGGALQWRGIQQRAAGTPQGAGSGGS